VSTVASRDDGHVTPHALMRVRRWAIVWGFALGLLCWIASNALRPRLPDIAGALSYLYVAIVVSGLFLWVLGHFVIASTVERVLRAGGLRCPRCGYCLDGLALAGACPECGARYERDRIVAWWHGYRRSLLGEVAERRPPSLARWWWWDVPKYEEPAIKSDQPTGAAR
jgi:hypothetical protein